MALFIIAVNLTAPPHELTHLLTQMAAGYSPVNLSFGAALTEGTTYVNTESVFWKIMMEGSAALFNILVGTVLLVLLKKFRFTDTWRVLLLQLTLLHLCMGFGYFLRDSISYSPNNGMGDWSKVLDRFNGSTVLRISILIVGTLGYLLTFYVAYKEAFHFIRDNNDKTERRELTSTLYLYPYLMNAVVFTLINLLSPMGWLNALIIGGVMNIFGFIAFFWGYMFVSHMVKPLKDSIYYFSLPSEKLTGIWICAVALLLIDIFILCPGIAF